MESLVQQECEQIGPRVVETTRERLYKRKQKLESSLQWVNAAIEALENYPDIDDILTKIGKAFN